VHRPDVFKIAFIGTHGVGKTTLCYGLAARLKALDVSLELVHEVARRCPLPINEETSLASQSWILHSQIAAESVAEVQYDVVICDRSALDNYVYLLLAEGHQDHLDGLVDRWMGTYDLLVHVPVIEAPSPDGVRSNDPGFQLAIEQRLTEELERRSLDYVELDVSDRDGWIETIVRIVVKRLEPPQLELL
jgi:nicotinamide riboside kinase